MLKKTGVLLLSLLVLASCRNDPQPMVGEEKQIYQRMAVTIQADILFDLVGPRSRALAVNSECTDEGGIFVMSQESIDYALEEGRSYLTENRQGLPVIRARLLVIDDGQMPQNCSGFVIRVLEFLEQ